MIKPQGAILTEDDLKMIIILGLPVECWDVDMNKIYTMKPRAIEQTTRGKIVKVNLDENIYMKWMGIPDETYKRTEVLWSVPDDQIGKAEAEYASMYIFNTLEEATAAHDAYRRAQAKLYAEKYPNRMMK